MTDETELAPSEASDDVVQADEAEQAEAIDESGQDDSQPSEGEDPEDKSPSKVRRERRKAEMERIRAENAELQEKYNRAQERLRRIDEAANSSQPPKESDFPTYEEYQAALVARASLKTMDERQRKEAEEEANSYKSGIDQTEQARRAEIAQNWADQVADAKVRYADFSTVFSDDVPVTAEAAELIASADNGADIAYYLGSNRKEAARIAKLPPLEQALAIGAIGARVSLPRSKTTSSAPAPITPVRGKATGVKSPDTMSMAEYIAARNAGKL